jgi:hypothetical protein
MDNREKHYYLRVNFCKSAEENEDPFQGLANMRFYTRSETKGRRMREMERGSESKEYVHTTARDKIQGLPLFSQ